MPPEILKAKKMENGEQKEETCQRESGKLKRDNSNGEKYENCFPGATSSAASKCLFCCCCCFVFVFCFFFCLFLVCLFLFFAFFLFLFLYFFVCLFLFVCFFFLFVFVFVFLFFFVSAVNVQLCYVIKRYEIKK